MSLGSVNTIIKKDVRLKCLRKTKAQSLTNGNKMARFNRCRHLLRHYPTSMVNFIWFTDEKLFTVKTPRNAQNDCTCAPVDICKKDVVTFRLLQTRSNFSRSLMVSVGVSALGQTAIYFIDPGVTDNGHYYCEVLLEICFQTLREFSEYYTFQQDSAPAHRARETIVLLASETPDFISPFFGLQTVQISIWTVNGTVNSLRHSQPFHKLRTRTTRFRNCFVPYCLNTYM